MDEAAALAGIEAEAGGVDRGGKKALLGKGAEAACSLGLQDGRASAKDGVRRRRNGEVVRESVECDQRRAGTRRSDAPGLEREAVEGWRAALGAVRGLPRVAEHDGGSAEGDAFRDTAGVGGVE